MNPMQLVMKNEIITKLSQRSFLLAAFGLPLLSFIIFGIVAIVNRNPSSTVSEFFDEPDTIEAVGYVDEAGLIATISPDVPADSLLAFPNEAAAQEALARGDITAIYVIPTDFSETSEVINIQENFNPMAAGSGNRWLIWTIEVNLAGGDADLAAQIKNPFDLEERSLATEPQRDEDNPLTFFLPYAITMLFYIIIFSTASHNISSMTVEKENRVIEILMTSIAPTQILAGKVLGLGVVGLLQALVWIGSSFLLMRLSGQTFGLASEFQLPVSVVLWGILFFILGYGLYASLMASIGALVPNLKEAAQAAFVVGSPLFLTLMLIGVLVQEPHGPIAITMSLFPLTSPVVMMTRLAAGGSVPIWQILLSVGLLILAILLIIRIVARLYHAQTLLSGQPFNLQRFFRALAGRGL